MITLIGKRVTLCEITETDGEAVVRWRNAEIIKRVFFSNETLTVGKQQAWMKAYRQDPSDITFIIEKDGSLSTIKVLRGINERLNSEAVKTLEASPKWNAGEMQGEKVRVLFTLPIRIKP